MTTADPAPLALRLTFSYAGSEVVLLSALTVEKALPPSDPLEAPDDVTGFFVELRNLDDQRLYRRAMHSPIRDSEEVFTPDDRESFTRVAIDKPTGVFTLVVPASREAPQLVLRNATNARGADRTFISDEVGRFDLTPHLPK